MLVAMLCWYSGSSELVVSRPVVSGTSSQSVKLAVETLAQYQAATRACKHVIEHYLACEGLLFGLRHPLRMYACGCLQCRILLALGMLDESHDG